MCLEKKMLCEYVMEHNLFLINIQKIMTSFVFAFVCFVITARK